MYFLNSFFGRFSIRHPFVGTPPFRFPLERYVFAWAVSLFLLCSAIFFSFLFEKAWPRTFSRRWRFSNFLSAAHALFRLGLRQGRISWLFLLWLCCFGLAGGLYIRLRGFQCLFLFPRHATLFWGKEHLATRRFLFWFSSFWSSFSFRPPSMSRSTSKEIIFLMFRPP